MDFAGILNANALYSFTIGTPQLGFALYFLAAISQEQLVLLSTLCSGLSIILSFANICCNFPRHLRKIAEKKAEQARDHLEAMRSTQTTVARLQEEAVNEKKHRFELAQNDDEGYKYATPSRVLDDVMKVEWNLMVNEVDVMVLLRSDRIHCARAFSSYQLLTPRVRASCILCCSGSKCIARS